MVINLLELFDLSVTKNGDKIAIVDGTRTISFNDLDKKSDILSQKIHNIAESVNRPVAVFLPKCIEAVIANIAIMKSANIFMNLDVKTPGQRLSNIVDLIEPVLIITDVKNVELINEVSGKIPILIIDDVNWEENINKETVKQQWSSVIDTDPFCIINTSGSTGTPKGVVLNHLSFLDFIYRSHEH